MQEVLERYHSANSTTPQSKPSGDLKIWVHLKHRDSTNCVNITVSVEIVWKLKVNAARLPNVSFTFIGYVELELCLDLCTVWRQVASFMLRMLHSWAPELVSAFKEIEIYVPCSETNPAVQLIAIHVSGNLCTG
jgi:hypothetical protein